MSEKLIGIPASKGRLTKGNTYKHRHSKLEACPECGSRNAYVDRWHTRLHLTCMRRVCRTDWYVKRWEDLADGTKRDRYIDYVGEEGVRLENEFKERSGTYNQPESTWH